MTVLVLTHQEQKDVAEIKEEINEYNGIAGLLILHQRDPDRHLIALAFRVPELTAMFKKPYQISAYAQEDNQAACLVCETPALQEGLDAAQLCQIGQTDTKAAAALLSNPTTKEKLGTYRCNILEDYISKTNPLDMPSLAKVAQTDHFRLQRARPTNNPPAKKEERKCNIFCNIL